MSPLYRKIFPGLPSGWGWLLWVAHLSVLIVGLKAGYDVGCQISGEVVGWIMAANSAVFCSLIFSTLANWSANLVARLRKP